MRTRQRCSPGLLRPQVLVFGRNPIRVNGHVHKVPGALLAAGSVDRVSLHDKDMELVALSLQMGGGGGGGSSSGIQIRQCQLVRLCQLGLGATESQQWHHRWRSAGGRAKA